MVPSTIRRFAAVAFLPLGILASCSTGKAPAVAAAETAVTVEVRPPSATVTTGGSVQFDSLVTGTAVVGVTWSVVETGGGAVDATGHYVAPGTPGTYHVQAASQASPATKALAVVTVQAPTPVTVTITPAAGAVDACKTLVYSASVSGSSNQSVTWSVQEGAAGGTFSAATYTAPASAGTYHVVATSVASPGSSATVPVTVADHVLAVAVNPPVVTVQTNGTATFTATVTTTCGAFSTQQAVAVTR